MIPIQKMIVSTESEIAMIRDQISIMETGRVRYHEQKAGGPMTDITANLLAGEHRKLALLEHHLEWLRQKAAP